MYPYQYLKNKEATPIDFINALSIILKKSNLDAHRPFINAVNGNGIPTIGLDGYALRAIVGTLNKGRDQGLDTFVGDAVLIRDFRDTEESQQTITAKDLRILKNFSVIGLYKELRKYSTKYIASRAVILLLVSYAATIEEDENV